MSVKDKIELYKSILVDNWLDFKYTCPESASDYYQNEIRKVLSCCTEENGFATFKCLNCGNDHLKVCFSCKGKGCLQCAERKARESFDKVGSQLMIGIEYRQMVLSIPEELREPFRCYNDKDGLYKDFMKLSYDFLLDFIRTYFHNDRIDIACITFIHSHGRDGKYIPPQDSKLQGVANFIYMQTNILVLAHRPFKNPFYPLFYFLFLNLKPQVFN